MNTAAPIAPHWPEIQRTVERGQRSTLHCAIASVDPNGLLYGTVGALRPATNHELRQIEQRVRPTR